MKAEVNVLQGKDKEKREVKTMKALFQKKAWIKGVLGAATFVLVFSFAVFTSEAAEGKVIADTAKIRAQADTGSEVVGSTVKGKTIDIVGVAADSSGTKWYKVPIAGGGYGYIRSDLVETSETLEVTESAATAKPAESTSKPADTVPTAIGETAATISEDSVRIRSGASTSHDAVTSLTKGTKITLIGEATDSAGKKWYQMTCDKNGRTVEGYVRSDLITIGEAVPETTAENPGGGDTTAAEGNGEGSEGGSEGAEGNSEGTEGNGEGSEGGTPEETEGSQEPSEEEYNDYEVVYKDDTYWLYDNINETMMSVTKLMDMVNQVNDNTDSLQKQVKNEKIVIIILAVIVVILVIAVTILIFKLKDAYYYEDEEEEEEEEEEPEPEIPRKKKKRVVEEEVSEETEPVRKKRVREGSQNSQEEVKRPVKKARPESELQAAEEKKPVKKPAKRKSQNFLVDDDEFEFEFLNMDDKDL